MELESKRIYEFTPDLHLKKVLCKLKKFGNLEGIVTVEGLIYVSKDDNMYSYFILQNLIEGSLPHEFLYIANRKIREQNMITQYGYKYSLYLTLCHKSKSKPLSVNSYIKEMFYLNSSVKSKIIEVWN